MPYKVLCFPSMNEHEDHAVLKRLDTQSSVIKRLHEASKDMDELTFVAPTPGNCECGWPYRMMLPRGTKVSFSV